MVNPELREMVAAFSSGDVFKKEDSILDGYLAQIIDRDQNALCLVNNQLRPEVVPAMVGVILSIKQSRMVSKMDAANQKIQFWFMFLAIASLASSVVQIALAICKGP